MVAVRRLWRAGQPGVNYVDTYVELAAPNLGSKTKERLAKGRASEGRNVERHLDLTAVQERVKSRLLMGQPLSSPADGLFNLVADRSYWE